MNHDHHHHQLAPPRSYLNQEAPITSNKDRETTAHHVVGDVHATRHPPIAKIIDLDLFWAPLCGPSHRPTKGRKAMSANFTGGERERERETLFSFELDQIACSNVDLNGTART